MEATIKKSAIEAEVQGDASNENLEDLKMTKSNLENKVWQLEKDLKDERET